MRFTDSLWQDCDECGRLCDKAVLFGEEEFAVCDECVREAIVKVMMSDVPSK